MSSSRGFFSSSIGKKYIMGITGLGLSLFVLIHMIENLLLFGSAESFNRWAHMLTSSPLIYGPELGLLALFLIHAINAVCLTRTNQAARPTAYAMSPQGEKGVCPASKTMIHTGMVILIFLVIHLATIKWGTQYEITYGDETMRDIKRTVIEIFSSPIHVGWYVLAMIALGFHLSHGVQASFQSLGWNHPSYTPTIKKIGIAFAIIVTLGFISEPLYIFLALSN